MQFHSMSWDVQNILQSSAQHLEQLYLRLQLQVNVYLSCLRSHTHGAQDDVKRSLVGKGAIKKCLTFEQLNVKVRSNVNMTGPYLRVSLKRISQLAVCLRAVLIGTADHLLFHLGGANCKI